MHAAKPGMGSGMAIEHTHQRSTLSQGGEQCFDMRLRGNTLAAFALRLPPAGI